MPISEKRKGRSSVKSWMSLPDIMCLRCLKLTVPIFSFLSFSRKSFCISSSSLLPVPEAHIPTEYSHRRLLLLLIFWYIAASHFYCSYQLCTEVVPLENYSCTLDDFTLNDASERCFLGASSMQPHITASLKVFCKWQEELQQWSSELFPSSLDIGCSLLFNFFHTTALCSTGLWNCSAISQSLPSV